MKATRSFTHSICISALTLCAALVVATTASAVSSGLPPAFGKTCGQVKGASWTYAGQTGIQYNVVGRGGTCTLAMKVVSALTKQKPHAGIVGPNTLNPPRGYKCSGTPPILRMHGGGCAISAAKGFSWAPRLK